ncbi:hypothetical protein PIB30_067112 [Stylosanthes scabra]|uniref:Uncharacterized protein n=1 Tax=Stylosanthes scabra TaxID=79078 RepID=A0ABU6RMF0_9FABA|nr:hypothetical protein [Stylosanthes scabra]
MGSSNAKMALLLLSIVVFINISNNHNYLAMASSSGGIMGGSFFDDSDFSSSVTFANDQPDRKYYSTQPCVVDDNNTHHQQHATSNNKDDNSWDGIFALIFIIFFVCLVCCCKHMGENTVSVLKVQVAILGGKKGSSILRDLTRIAHTSDTSSPGGVSKLLIETILALNQNPGDWIAGYSYVDLIFSKEDGEKSYIQSSYEESAKLFHKETLINFSGKEKISTRSQSAYVFINNDEYKMMDEKTGKKPDEEKFLLINGFGNEYIVITILVAARGTHKLPSINGPEDLKRTLRKLRSIPSSNLLAGEVLWTPQKDDDTLSEDELIEDYPQLAKAMRNFKKKE